MNTKSSALGRSFLGSAGICSGILAVLAWRREGYQFEEWPLLGYLMFSVLIGLSVICVALCLFAPSRMVERWANAVSNHEASFILILVAVPVYWLARLFSDRKIKNQKK